MVGGEVLGDLHRPVGGIKNGDASGGGHFLDEIVDVVELQTEIGVGLFVNDHGEIESAALALRGRPLGDGEAFFAVELARRRA